MPVLANYDGWIHPRHNVGTYYDQRSVIVPRAHSRNAISLMLLGEIIHCEGKI